MALSSIILLEVKAFYDKIIKKPGTSKNRAFLWNKFNKFENFFIGKVFNLIG